MPRLIRLLFAAVLLSAGLTSTAHAAPLQPAPQIRTCPPMCVGGGGLQQDSKPRPCLTATVCKVVETSLVPGTPGTDDGQGSGDRHLDGVVASWYIGWQFQYRSVCIETSWSTAFGLVDAVAAEWKALNNGLLNVYVRKTAGGCGASGFPASQRTVFVPATMADNICGSAPTSYSATTGFVITSQVKINTSAATAQPCRTGTRWKSLGLHEFGHSQGFDHTPYSETDSVMHPADDGIDHPSQTYEKPRQASIYNNNPLWWPAPKAAAGPPCVVCW